MNLRVFYLTRRGISDGYPKRSGYSIYLNRTLDSLKEVITQFAKIRGWKTLVFNYLLNVIFRFRFR